MLKETDLWIDWTCKGELEALFDKVAAHGVPPELGAQFVSRLAAILHDLQQHVNELEDKLEEACQ